jgi:hypothetical protein
VAGMAYPLHHGRNDAHEIKNNALYLLCEFTGYISDDFLNRRFSKPFTIF